MTPNPAKPVAATSPERDPGVPVALTDASCRGPLLFMFVTASTWLLIGSVFALIASIKFHGPNFLADSAWLTYGRARPTHLHCWLYGFGVQAGLGVMIWLFARLGRTPLQQPILAAAGAVFWNLGVLLGTGGILSGDAAGYEGVEMPAYAAGIMFIGYLLLGLSAAFTLHQRHNDNLYVSQWFLVPALFWFPWIFSSVQLLTNLFPSRGLAGNIVAWWFLENLQILWFWSIAFAVLLYLIPKLTGRALNSRHTALFTFWMLLLFGGWGGIPYTAPLPSWLPVLSNIGIVLTTITVITVLLNVHHTLNGNWRLLAGNPTLSFLQIGLISFALFALTRLVVAVVPAARVVELTWFEFGESQVNAYGFFFVTLFGAMYYIAPHLLGRSLSPGLVRLHWWLALTGAALAFAPLLAGGVLQGAKLQDPTIAFMEVSNSTLHFLRLATVGDLLLLAGHMVLVLNLAAAASAFYRTRATEVALAIRATAVARRLEARA